jgi:hypothetical protein
MAGRTLPNSLPRKFFEHFSAQMSKKQKCMIDVSAIIDLSIGLHAGTDERRND